MQIHNPVGTDGFDFLEFTTNDPQKLIQQFESMGFKQTGKHKSHDVIIYQQNDIRFIINLTQHTHANHFAKSHGASVCAMGFRVNDAKQAYQHALTFGAKAYIPDEKNKIYDKKLGYKYNENLWRIRVSNAQSLEKLFNNLSPYLKHKKRVSDFYKCLKNSINN